MPGAAAQTNGTALTAMIGVPEVPPNRCSSSRMFGSPEIAIFCVTPGPGFPSLGCGQSGAASSWRRRILL